MSDFDRVLTGFRFIEVRWNDTLQAIAARELNDASKWALVANINGLRPPYLTGDQDDASDTVKLYGSLIRVPGASLPVDDVTTDPDAIYLSDLSLDNGELRAENGDIALVSGRSNLRQALSHRVVTDKGELLFHLDYGCQIRKILGAVNGPTSALLAAEYVKSAILADSRIRSVTSVNVVAGGDVTAVVAVAVPITGTSVTLSTQV